MLIDAFNLMNKKIKKSLLNTDRNEREDLEQEIKLKVIEAVLTEKIKMPPSFRVYKEQFDRKNRASEPF